MDPRVLIMGPQGAGKGTQSKKLVEAYGIEHVTTGDALRANPDLETEHGTPREYMEAGELVPDPVVNEIVETALQEAGGFVLDGYPRNRSQAEYLADVADVDVLVYVSVPEEVSVERLSGRRVCESCGTNFHVDFDPPAEPGVCDECGGELVQREDDTPEVIRTRLEEQWAEQTRPVIDYYREETDVPVEEVDGEGTPDEVFERVRAAVEAHADP